MSAGARQDDLLEPDREQLETFATAILKNVPTDQDAFVSLRAFTHDNKIFRKAEAVSIRGGLRHVCEAAQDWARRCANASMGVVFCPPVAVLSSSTHAREEDLLYGPALSVECDVAPEQARVTLEDLLGPPTLVVKSGGEWIDGETGQIQHKTHLHWRLKVPATAGDLARLKQARVLASAIVGADTSNEPIIHPIRWPGSWHRKGKPRLCTIESTTDNEIDLDTVIPLLAAAPKKARKKANGEAKAWDGERADWDELVGNIIAGKDLHESIAKIAAKMVRGGQNDGTIVNFLRGLMQHSDARVSRFFDWHARVSDIPRAVATAREKFDQPAFDAVPPIDLWAKLNPPELPPGLLPPIIERFAVEQGRMMGADPAGLVIAALTVCAAAIPDSVGLQVKEHDPSWTECARLWAALIGDPSSKKSPMLDVACYALKRIDAKLAQEYMARKAEYDSKPSEERKGIDPPKRTRVRIEDITIEAAQEILKDSPDGVLCKRDELSGWFGGMDKYSAGKGAAADRAFWLSAYNGGEYVSDRVGRGTCYIPNLSVSLLGGIQPGVIRQIIGQTVDDGLIQRLIPIALRSATVGKDEPRPDAVTDYNDLVESLYKGGRRVLNRVVVQFTAEGQAVRRRLEHKHVDLMNCEAVNRKLAAHIGKYDGIFARLCLIWRCIEEGVRPGAISGDIAERVARFLHGFLLPHAVSFYAGDVGLSEDQDHLQELAGYILAHAPTELTFREISRCGGALRRLKRPEMTAVLEQLHALGWVTQVPGPRPMSPSRWVVNPSCRKVFAERAERETKRRHGVAQALKDIFDARRAEVHG